MTTDKKIQIKSPPNSKESEMMVLGCALGNINALNIVQESLDKDDFYYEEHSIIFSTLETFYQRERPTDIHLVAEELKRCKKLDIIGGISYLTTLSQYAGTAAHIEEYAELVKNKAILRRMIATSQEVESSALRDPSNVGQCLDDAQAKFFTISQRVNAKIGVTLKEHLSGIKNETNLPYLKELEIKQKEFYERDPNEVPVTGLATGLIDLDKIISGFNPANLIILAGRPSMGKTALALNIAQNILEDQNAAIGIFSLEMTAGELIHRLICCHSQVESEKIKTGALDGSEYQQIVTTVNTLQNHTLIIDDQPGIKITDLRTRARRLKEIYDIKFLVIDYLQLLTGSRSHTNTDNRQTEISEISRLLKNLARELNIPILCGSQLSRKVEERPGHRPLLSDLRESGAIEQDADIVLLLFRREYYNPNDKPGIAEVLIAKNRHGSTGEIELAFRKQLAQFSNLTHTPTPENNASNNAFSQFSP